MKRTLPVILALALVLAMNTAALAEGNLITVNGTATVSLQADSAVIELGALTRGASVAEAQAENQRILEAVLQALRDANVAEEDMSTSNYSVYAEIPYQEYASSTPAAPVYNVTNMLRVKIRELDMAAQVIDLAARAGANQVYGMTFTSSKQTEGHREAMLMALEDARQKAELLARASGLTLGAVESITTLDYYGNPYMSASSKDMRAEAGTAPSIVSGAIEVGATITVAYQMK